MTNLPRLTVSLPPDIEQALDNMKREPDNAHVPRSKLLCELVRRGMERKSENKEAATAVNQGRGKYGL